MTTKLNQLELFHVQKAYSQADKPLSNEALYASVADIAGIPRSALQEQSAIGKAGTRRSKLKRKIRWYQQTLKTLNLLERVEGERGVWQLSKANKKGLHEALGGARLLAYSTNLGLAVWSSNKTLFGDLDEPIHLCVTTGSVLVTPCHRMRRRLSAQSLAKPCCLRGQERRLCWVAHRSGSAQ